jgi:hypothetical protein
MTIYFGARVVRPLMKEMELLEREHALLIENRKTARVRPIRLVNEPVGNAG